MRELKDFKVDVKHEVQQVKQEVQQVKVDIRALTTKFEGHVRWKDVLVAVSVLVLAKFSKLA